MNVINFIIDNILTQASITISLIAMLGLILQKKSVGQIISGTITTLLGFKVLNAGSSIIVGSLTYFRSEERRVGKECAPRRSPDHSIIRTALSSLYM